ncbi:hypothetical protein TrVE_jg12451 [Triparma verrucosa]|uniref:Uncharacterized protein n=1 Tax=Triparma verrucosa TaxID=1606542 RepID=A0A9W7BBF9_9STRA|nr:hypothetical protein TrVE_jg12451 [Triparma verrucosa]
MSSDLSSEIMMKELDKRVEEMGAKIEARFSAKLTSLQEEVKELREELRASKAVNTQTFKCSKGWRAMFQAGGLITPALAALGFMRQSEKLLWTARSFNNFSMACTLLACGANPKNFGSWKEKAYMVTSISIYYLSVYTYGLGLSRADDDAAVKSGKMIIMMAIFGMLVALPGILTLVKLFSKLSDAKLSSVVLSIFQSAASFLGSLLYLQSSSFRCISQSDEKLGSIVDQCGNPMQPATVVSAYLIVAWAMRYAIAPLTHASNQLSWKDVMDLRMSKMQFTQGALFSTLTLIALVIFANTNENGAEYDHFLQLLVSGFYIVFFSYLTLLFCEFGFRQLFCKHTTTTTDDDTRGRDNSGAFGLHEEGMSSGMI